MYKKSKAWIYCRIDAPEDVHGMLKAQRKQLMDYAEQMGFQVEGSSTDLAVGSSQIRPGWEYFLKTVPLRQVEVLLVYNLSRIHRDTCQALKILEQLQKMGIAVYSPLEGKLNFGFQRIIGRMEGI